MERQTLTPDPHNFSGDARIYLTTMLRWTLMAPALADVTLYLTVVFPDLRGANTTLTTLVVSAGIDPTEAR